MKRNALQILMTAILAFAFTGASAQWVDSSTPAESVDSVTVGVTVPYYVQPDSYFNPDFVAPNTDVVSTFNWTFPGTDVTIGTENQNYVEMSFDAAGSYTLEVEEISPFNSCPGPAQTLDVLAIAAPEISLAAAATGIIGSDTTMCDAAAEQGNVVQVEFTTSVIDPYNFTLDYTYTVETTTDQTTWTEETALDYTGANAITGINALTYDLNDHANNFAVVGSKSTRYTYTISGVTDRISRKSDYLTNTSKAAGAWTLYDTTSETIVITVHPAPQTGPIYHISNMWAQ